MSKIYTIKREGKIERRYYVMKKIAFEYSHIHYGTFFGESPEAICKQWGWDIKDYRFTQEPYSSWELNIPNIEIVKEEK